MIIFLYHSKCLNSWKTTTEASMAVMMGAWKDGALIASIEVPKHRYVMISMVRQR